MATLQMLPHLSLSSTASSGNTAAAGGMEQFPAGLRVMVVDDDVTCLRILEQMLRRCSYVVTTFTQATVALDILRERKGCFDLVLSDVHMPDMDGFKLLELVGLEMDLPVIMMSADGRTSAVMRGIRHGACDYLLKPIREEELKNIWQHVLRKKWNETREPENAGSLDDNDRHKRGSDDAEYASSANEGSEGILKIQKKRRDAKEDDGELENEDPAASKKPRVVWSVELHQQFVSAVDQLGIDKAVPKRILELMNVPGLTRENVASHLQKFRLYLKRLSVVAQQQAGMPSSFGGPLEPNSQLCLLGRYNLEAMAASGHIPPQSLAVLQAELLGRPTGSLVMPAMDQSTLQGQKYNSVDHGVMYGQPLAKCSSNISKQFPQHTACSENGPLGAGVSDNLGTMGISRNVSGINSQNGNMLIATLQNQQQHIKQQKKQPLLQEPTRSINVQPSCLVVPSQSASLQAGNGSASGNQSCFYNVSSGNNYSFQIPQSNNPSFSVGHTSDGDLKMTSVLRGYSGPSSCSPSVSSCSTNAETGVGGQLQNSVPTFGAIRQVVRENDIKCSYNEKSSQALDYGPLGNPGFVGKGTLIPSRFAVDDSESPMSHYSHRGTYWESSDGKVKQEPSLKFAENAKLGSSMLQNISPNDIMSVFSD